MDLSTIFGAEALTYEQFTEKTKDLKLVDLKEGGYVDANKFEKVNTQLTNAQQTIKQLEANAEDAEALKKQISDYKAAEEKRAEAEKEAQRVAGLRARFDPLKGEHAYLNEGTETWIFEEFQKALADKANTGKSDADIYAEVVKDKNIYVNPQTPFRNPPSNGRPASEGNEEYYQKKYGSNPWRDFNLKG